MKCVHNVCQCCMYSVFSWKDWNYQWIILVFSLHLTPLCHRASLMSKVYPRATDAIIYHLGTDTVYLCRLLNWIIHSIYQSIIIKELANITITETRKPAVQSCSLVSGFQGCSRRGNRNKTYSVPISSYLADFKTFPSKYSHWKLGTQSSGVKKLRAH